MAGDLSPLTVGAETTTIATSATQAGIYTALGAEVTSIGVPGAEQTKVDTWGLGSANKTSRPGKIPDFGTISIKLYADPNFSGHAALMAAASNGLVQWFKVTYGDSFTTHATHTFSGWIKSLKPMALEGEKNLEWTLEIVVVTPPVFVTGTTP